MQQLNYTMKLRKIDHFLSGSDEPKQDSQADPTRVPEALKQEARQSEQDSSLAEAV